VSIYPIRFLVGSQPILRANIAVIAYNGGIPSAWVNGAMGGNMRILFFLVLLLGCWTAQARAQTLQPGDTLTISVYQDPKLDRQVLVGPTGMISFPLAGQIRAAGLTPDALASAIKARIRSKFTEEPDVTVSLVAIKVPEEDLKPRIFVTGEVLRPGFFVMRQKLNVMQAISEAGGFSPFAAKKRIQVRRKIEGGESLFVFDYDAFFSGRNFENNISLVPGDVVIVPERGLFE
jgi:polysaccharide biosynthesis/export protein